MLKKAQLNLVIVFFAFCFIVSCNHEPEISGQILIGTTVSLSGEYMRPSSEQFNGLQLWAEKTNAEGGLMGHEVKLVYYDDESQPEKSAKLVEKLITRNRVDALVSPYSSPSVLAASKVTESHSFPMLVVGASASEIWQQGYKNVFGLYTPARLYMNQVLIFAKQKGLSKIALIYEDSLFPRDLATGVKAEVKSLGLKLVFDVTYEKDQKDFSKIISELKESGADVVIGGSYLRDSVSLTLEADKQHYEPKIIAFAVGPGLPDFGAQLGARAEGIMGNSQWERTLPFPEISEFVKSYEKRYGYMPGYHAAGGFGAGELLGQVIMRTRTLQLQRLRETLGKLKTTTVFGRYEVDSSGMQIGKPAYTIQWLGNSRVVVLPESVAERQPRFPFNKD